MKKMNGKQAINEETNRVLVETKPLVVGKKRLNIKEVESVSKRRRTIQVTDDSEVILQLKQSCDYIERAVENGSPIYGVTSGFGGMANVSISPEQAVELQNNLVVYHKVGAGKKLSVEDVRAAMLLRINSHMRGVSGIRLELIKRMELFLNANVIPHVYEFGSIGASGDLTPLSYITGAITGMSEDYKVDFDGAEMGAISALLKLGLTPIQLRPKEGLAMMNGTAFMTGIAVNCIADASTLFKLNVGAHALMLQGLQGTNQSFHPFIHDYCKPHSGQKWVASTMLELLKGSSLVHDELDGTHNYRGNQPIQDRYSLRCLAQYIGPIFEGIDHIKKQVEIEINSATDNPLIDVENQVSYHGGNFLGQHIGIAMDQLRYYNGMLAKHLDVQIALLVTPEFNNGLSASLVGNTNRRVNMGLKGLQITGNSLMPLISFYGNSLADRFPTHAEQFNQNINSQGFGSANLTTRSIEIFQQYMAVALMFGVQAVDLRTYQIAQHYDATTFLSPITEKLYTTVKEVIGVEASKDRPYVWNDSDRSLDRDIALIAADISKGGKIATVINSLLDMDQITPSDL